VYPAQLGPTDPRNLKPCVRRGPRGSGSPTQPQVRATGGASDDPGRITRDASGTHTAPLDITLGGASDLASRAMPGRSWAQARRAVGFSFIPAGRSIWPQGDCLITKRETWLVRIWFGPYAIATQVAEPDRAERCGRMLAQRFAGLGVTIDDQSDRLDPILPDRVWWPGPPLRQRWPRIWRGFAMTAVSASTPTTNPSPFRGRSPCHPVEPVCVGRCGKRGGGPPAGARRVAAGARSTSSASPQPTDCAAPASRPGVHSLSPWTSTSAATRDGTASRARRS
jgi:hypothetical protein